MPNWNDPAGTLQRVAEELRAAWTSLTPARRNDLAGLVRAYGPQIAGDRLTTVLRINFLLGELWDRRAELPAGAVAALQASQGAPALRGGGALSGPAREQLIAALLALVDFRSYSDAPALAERLVRLVDEHLDRLTDEERSRWQALKAGYGPGEDAAGFLDAAEELLGGYSAVRALLESGKTLAPPSASRAAVRRGVPGPLPGYRATPSMTGGAREVVSGPSRHRPGQGTIGRGRATGNRGSFSSQVRPAGSRSVVAARGRSSATRTCISRPRCCSLSVKCPLSYTSPRRRSRAAG